MRGVDKPSPQGGCSALQWYALPPAPPGWLQDLHQLLPLLNGDATRWLELELLKWMPQAGAPLESALSPWRRVHRAMRKATFVFIYTSLVSYALQGDEGRGEQISESTTRCETGEGRGRGGGGLARERPPRRAFFTASWPYPFYVLYVYKRLRRLPPRRPPRSSLVDRQRPAPPEPSGRSDIDFLSHCSPRPARPASWRCLPGPP